ncbi:CbtA family protein [Pelagovum sp. HNIBRBA483]|uniref:CbtA family protein n=1 Tax=Pelagovum sp. HNIBRBA483 TaxID=3233341 RepID=UPI0034A0E93F
MAKNLVTSALFAGVAVGVLAAILQFMFVVPLLMEGELYETGARVHFSVGGAESEAGAPPIWGDMGRHIGTVAMNLVAYTGFAFVMVAGFALAKRTGHEVNGRVGAVWGLAGFIAVQLAPAFGLPPELPGTAAADLGARQIWWAGCVLATLLGIASMTYVRNAAGIAVGVLLIAAPHVIGAPHLDAYYGIAPPELASHFVTRSLGVAAASWVMLGSIAGALWARKA